MTIKSIVQSVFPGASSEDLPFLCVASLVLKHKLNKMYLEIKKNKSSKSSSTGISLKTNYKFELAGLYPGLTKPKSWG